LEQRLLKHCYRKNDGQNAEVEVKKSKTGRKRIVNMELKARKCSRTTKETMRVRMRNGNSRNSGSEGVTCELQVNGLGDGEE
jgi:hypothetical protein